MVGVALQHLAKLDGGRVRIMIGVQKIEARLHDSFLDCLFARYIRFSEPGTHRARGLSVVETLSHF